MTEHSAPDRRGWNLMVIVLGIEFLAGLFLLWETFRLVIASTADPVGQRVSLLLIVLVGVMWAVVTLSGGVKRRSWARASNLTLQVLLVAAAVGVIQGILGTPLVGSLLLIIAVIGFIASLMIRPAEHTPVREEL